MGYNPVKLNYYIKNYLSRLGVLSADRLEINKEYKWISLEELTDDERKVLGNADKIAQKLGENPPEVRVYSGLFLQTGREVESDRGVWIKEKDGRRYIGVKRNRLGNLVDFADTFIHELGHDSTNADDSNRKFAGYFIGKLAEKVAYEIENEVNKGENPK